MFSGLENPTHWLVVIVIALVLLGPKRLPELGRSLGSGIRDFKHSLEGKDEPPAEPPSSAAPPSADPQPSTVTAQQAKPDAP